MIRNTPKRIQFVGGVNKAVERAVLNGFSDKNNLRDRHPGFVSRRGQSRHHSTTDAIQEIYTIFQQVDKAGNRNFYAQRANGSVHRAVSEPPATTAGNFGVEVLPPMGGTRTASTSILDDYLIYSDGQRGHQVYAGVGQRIKGFHVYRGTSAIPVIPKIGEDYTNEVTDPDPSRVAILDSLNTLAAFNAIYICTEVPCNSLTITMRDLNTVVSALSAQYWRSDGVWASIVGLVDGTSVGGVTFRRSGVVSWTHPTDEIPHYQFGRTGYWYRFSVSARLSALVSVSHVTYTGNWRVMENVWDGGLVPVLEAQTYKAAGSRLQAYPHNAIDIGGMFAHAGDWVYFGSLEKLCGVYLFVSNTPNIIRASITGSSDITFVDGGTGDGSITWQQGRFDIEGFEEGQNIVITGTLNNNRTVRAKSVSFGRISVETGLVRAEANTSATLTFDNTVGNVMTMEFWNGNAWVGVSNFNDGSNVASKSGFITFSRTTLAQKVQLNDSPFYAYWYRFRLSRVASRRAQISLEGMPFYNIAELGRGVCNATWIGRPVLSFDRHGSFIHIGGSGRVNCINGSDFRPFNVSDDGRNNKVIAMTPFYQHLMVWQEEIGMKGGSVSLIQGYDPETFQKYTISGDIGIVNTKAHVTVDGVPTPNNPKASHAKMVYWISRKGIYMTDGIYAINISEPIGIYFDTTNTANCIRMGFEDKHWLRYDSLYKCLRIGLCTGTTATVVNTWLVYDIQTGSWGTDTLGQAITCMAEVEAARGNIPVLQYGGGSDGFVYRLNTGLSDVGASAVPIHSFVVLEIDGEGNKLDVQSLQLRCKAQPAGNITPSIAFNGNTSFTDEVVRTMTPNRPNDAHRTHDFLVNREHTDHISIRFSHNAVGEEMYLLDMVLLNVEGKNVFKG
ncbi:MAG: hypothetical protein DDT19_01525 [Syntrophomonadaceae bacterium]|nr:hypothetical protein [Bacillota bacterium]